MIATKTSKCVECPCRVQETFLFIKRNRCGIHGRYIALDHECTLTLAEARRVHAFMARVILEKTLTLPQ